MLRILLVNDSPDPIEALSQALRAGPYLLPDKGQADVLLVYTNSPSPHRLQQLSSLNLPVLMLASDPSPQAMRAALQAGVSAYFCAPFAAEQLSNQLALAQAQFEHRQALLQRISHLEQQLADRKIIDQAKGVLMAKRQLSEADAYDVLRRQAMKQGKKLAEVARQLLLMADVLG